MLEDNLADIEETRMQQYIDSRKARGRPPALSILATDYAREIQNKLDEFHGLEQEVVGTGLLAPEETEPRRIVQAADYLQRFSEVAEGKDQTSLSDRLDVSLEMARWMQEWEYGSIVFDDAADVALDGILFIGNVWLKAQACKELSLPNAYFSGSLYLDLPEVDVVDLSFAETRGSLHMEADRTGETIFEGAFFNTWVDFRDRKFVGHVIFDGAWFLREAEFSDTKFLGHTYFQNTYFSRNVNFGQAEFGIDAVFSATTFKGRADFSEALFKSAGDFRNASFGNANFRDTTFSSKTSFEGAKFYGNAIFDWANFKGTELGYVLFKQTEFFDSASFKATKFPAEADFQKSTFMGHTDFQSAHFHGIAEFGAAAFQGTCSFFESRFRSSLNVNNTHFLTRVDFQQTTFAYLPDFRYVKFDAETDLRAAKIRRQYKTAPTDGKGTEKTSIVEIIRHHKSLAINARDHRGALDRGANELRAEYIEFADQPEASTTSIWRGRLLALLPAIPAAMYFAIASNGRSFWRPLAWAFVTTGAMALVYAKYDSAYFIGVYVLSLVGYILGMAYGYGRLKIPDEEMQYYARLGLAGIVLVTLALLFDSWNSTVISEALQLAGLISANPLRVFTLIFQGDDLLQNGMYDPSRISAVSQVIVQVHATVSLALLFLIGLALRNIFKIG